MELREVGGPCKYSAVLTHDEEFGKPTTHNINKSPRIELQNKLIIVRKKYTRKRIAYYKWINKNLSIKNLSIKNYQFKNYQFIN